MWQPASRLRAHRQMRVLPKLPSRSATMRMFKISRRSAPPRAVAGLTFAVALLGTVGCTAAPVAEIAPQIDAVAGQQFTGTVDSFTDTNADATTHYAFVDWGDGQFSEVSVVQTDTRVLTDTGPAVVYDVSGSNTYQAAGDYTATAYFLGGQEADATLADIPTTGVPSQDQANA